MPKKGKRALIIGRFQPFHSGHLNVIKHVLKECGTVILAIGSAQYSHTTENPFTAGERHMMISRALETNGITNYYLIPIEDVNRYDVWVSHVTAIVPPFDYVYTNNPLTRQLFLERGYKVKSMPVYDRKKYSGREIRRRMIFGDDWEALVPEEVSAIIRKIDGVERIRTLAAADIYVPENTVAKLLAGRGLTIAVAESCTGGLLSHTLTNVPDASKFFTAGFVVYSEKAKRDLGVQKRVLDRFGAVSAEAASELASRVRENEKSDIGVGITGYAGPGGEVGSVYVAVAGRGAPALCKSFNFNGSREEIKEKAVSEALKMIMEFVKSTDMKPKGK